VRPRPHDPGLTDARSGCSVVMRWVLTVPEGYCPRFFHGTDDVELFRFMSARPVTAARDAAKP
jgi:hypothetical protein